MSCAFGSAAHLVKFVVEVEFTVCVHLDVALKVIRINELSMQKPQNGFKSLLRIPHLSFLV